MTTEPVIQDPRSHSGDLYLYLQMEWKRTKTWNRWGRYFDLWFDNLTDTQIHQYQVWMSGRMGPF
jgi:hypothetical protein